MELVPAILYIVQNYSGLAMPAIIDFVNQKVENSKVRFLISIVLSIALATLLNLDKVLASQWSELLGTVSFVFAQSQIVYKLYWENSKARAKVFGVDVISDPNKLKD